MRPPLLLLLLPAHAIAVAEVRGAQATQPPAQRVPLSSYTSVSNARNCWTCPVDTAVLAEAAQIFQEHLLPHFNSMTAEGVTEQVMPCKRLVCSSGRFFAIQPSRSDWKSDIAWISVDDEPTYRRFERLFRKLEIPQRFAKLVDHEREVKLFSAHYVVRSVTEGHHFHSDYAAGVGSNGLTLMTPISDYSSKDDFHLLYQDRDGAIVQYKYRQGEAIVFGEGFMHSTQPGSSRTPHAYLCFTFGSDKPVC